jgi:hypothetical protein
MKEERIDYLWTPLERLSLNKEKGKDFSISVIEGRVKSSSKEALESQLDDALDQRNFTDFILSDFTKVIASLSQLKDLRSNIKSYISADLGTGNKALVRDGRDAINPPIIAPESYSMMAANHARAAIEVLDNAYKRGEIKEDKYESAKRLTNAKAVDFIRNTQNQFERIPSNRLSVTTQNNKKNKNSAISNLEKELKQFNTSIVEVLESNGIKEAQKKVKVAKEFANFEDEHYHVSTISKIKDATVIETETMNLGLTDQQKAMFEAVKKCTVTKDNIKMHAGGDNMEWFNNQPRWKQDLIHASADAILSETKVIPTQLRAELPLLRNAYTKTVYVKNKGGKFEECFEATHSGTLTTDIPPEKKPSLFERFFGKKSSASQAAADGNIEQLKLFSESGKVHLNLQTSPNNISLIDVVDINDREYISGSEVEGSSKSTSAFNKISRRLPGGGRDFSGFKEIIDYVESKNLKESEGLKSLKEAKRLMKSASFFSWDREHINSQISERMAIASYQLSKEHPKLEIPLTNISCASGKDRTQMVLIGASSRAIAEKLSNNPAEVAKALSISGSSQHLSGTNGGGTIGCYGQKPQTSSSANKTLFKESAGYFGQRTADLNKFKVNKKGMFERLKDFIFLKKEVKTNIEEPKKLSNHVMKNVEIEMVEVKKELAGSGVVHDPHNNVFNPLHVYPSANRNSEKGRGA